MKKRKKNNKRSQKLIKMRQIEDGFITIIRDDKVIVQDSKIIKDKIHPIKEFLKITE